VAESPLSLDRRDNALAPVSPRVEPASPTLRYGDEPRPADDYFPKGVNAEAKLTRRLTEQFDAWI
jgi:hypothetical protein